MDALIGYASLHDREHSRRTFWVILTVQLTWLAILIPVLYVLGALTFENAYILSYLGLVIATQLFAPAERTPQWWWTVRWGIRLGFLGFCYFIVLRVVDVINL